MIFFFKNHQAVIRKKKHFKASHLINQWSSFILAKMILLRTTSPSQRKRKMKEKRTPKIDASLKENIFCRKKKRVTIRFSRKSQRSNENTKARVIFVSFFSSLSLFSRMNKEIITHRSFKRIKCARAHKSRV